MQSPESEFIDEASFQPELQACFFCVVVFSVTSYMDWGDLCVHRGSLVRALGIEQLRQRLDRMTSGFNLFSQFSCKRYR